MNFAPRHYLTTGGAKMGTLGQAVVYDLHDFGGKSFLYDDTDMRLPLASVSLAGAKNLSIKVSWPSINGVLFDVAGAENITITAIDCTEEFDFQQADFQTSKQVTLDLKFAEPVIEQSLDFRQAVFAQRPTSCSEPMRVTALDDTNFDNAQFNEFQPGIPAYGVRRPCRAPPLSRVSSLISH